MGSWDRQVVSSGALEAEPRSRDFLLSLTPTFILIGASVSGGRDISFVNSREMQADPPLGSLHILAKKHTTSVAKPWAPQKHLITPVL